MKRYSSSQALVIVLVGSALLWTCLNQFVFPHLIGSERAKVPMSKAAERLFLTAMESFRTEFGSYPAGDEATILKALAGDNAKEIRFLNLSVTTTNKLGQYTDPWKMPYRLIATATNITIQSAGDNKKFDDADDIIMSSGSVLQ